MTIEQAINYLKSSGMSDEQIIEVADALTKGAISQLRAEVLNVFDKYAESEVEE